MTFKTQTYAGHPPCYGCTDRRIKCHAECEQYKEWLNKLEAIKHEREKSLQYSCYLADKAKKHKTKGGDQYEKQYGKRRHK